MHFGHHDPEIVERLEGWLGEHRPDLVVISGDFTQRARVAQYRLACEFLDRLEAAGLKVLGVPGNHDVPLYDIVRRFVRPLARYRRYIDEELCPWFEDDQLAVLGINTARSFTFKDGSISREQMDRIRACFADVPSDKARILVTHHPLFEMPIGEEGALTKVVKRHQDALGAVADAGVHLLLAGHFHRSFVRSARELVETVGPALVIQAGTATSTRLRGDELQSFNWIDTAADRVDLEIVAWTGEDFVTGKPVGYRFDGENWHAAPAEALA